METRPAKPHPLDTLTAPPMEVASKHELRRLLAMALGVVVATASAQELNADTQGRIEFISYTPKTMFDLVRERRQNWQAQHVWGDLTLPRGGGVKVPAIVLMHGSGGIGPAMKQWVDAFNDIGVATFVVSSFEPRGVKQTIDDQTQVPAGANVVDALQALQLLATHPRVDAARVGVMGFSRGGSVAFQVALEPIRRAVIKSALKFALHIPAYAGCNQVYWSSNTTKAPILNLLGKDDDYTTAEPCEQLARRYADAGTNVRTIEYPGAHHAWDSVSGVTYLPNATSSAACGVIRWDIEPWTITAEGTGQRIEPAEAGNYLNACMQHGVHVGRNEEAFKQSRKDAVVFVRELFFPGQP